jgi:hypothetical protein
MRKLFIFISLVSALLSGCIDGEDGDAYLAFFWTTDPTFYADNNPSLPGTIFLLQDYLVGPGTYSFEYTVGATYFGTYTITEEEGEPGIFPLIPGPDGDDSYFELGLFSTGPIFFEYSTDLQQTAMQGTASLNKSEFNGAIEGDNREKKGRE